MEIGVVDGASAEARGRSISALTLAFSRDPVMRWMYPAAEQYLTHFPRFAEAFGGPAFEAETAWCVSDGSGAALWLPSGVHPDGDGIEAVAYGTVAEEKHDTMGRIFEKMGEWHPEEPHWYLAIIGVDAAHQGRGLGARLMEAALERCDAEGLIAYLESSNPANVSLYRRHGFEVIGEIQAGDAPPIQPMLRPARGTSR
jgi:ribosomal protein S18 acetylase RimI-like enzyme